MVRQLALSAALVIASLGCKKQEDRPAAESAPPAASQPGDEPAPPVTDPQPAPADPPSPDKIALLAKLSPGKGYRRSDMQVEIHRQGDRWVTATGDAVDEEDVIDASAIQWSPDRKWAVVVVSGGCGDLCHEGAWLVGPGVDRMLEGDHPKVVAWNPKAPEVAIEFVDVDFDETPGKETHSVAVYPLDAASEGRRHAGFAAPSYSNEGVLEIEDEKGRKHSVGPDGKVAG